MARTFNMHDAKTNLSRLVERALAGEEILIARAGQPVVQLVPYHRRKRVPGSARGQFMVHDTFDDPLPPELFSGGTDTE
jgi:prevent-host-death family protein